MGKTKQFYALTRGQQDLDSLRFDKCDKGLPTLQEITPCLYSSKVSNGLTNVMSLSYDRSLQFLMELPVVCGASPA